MSSGKNSQPWRRAKKPAKPLRPPASLLLEDDEVGLDVGVLADRVGVRVVARVLVHPPGVADADDEVGHDAAEHFVETRPDANTWRCASS